jgi:acetyl-CoA carboxylase carboxyltransferase component
MPAFALDRRPLFLVEFDLLSHRGRFANPYVTASRCFVDDAIDPRETRYRIIRALGMLQDKTDTNSPRKDGNIPF